ncbi:MAG: nucleotidyltransferase domain-containing protein [Deltaproteobacteria bacterium]|nr:nucleotidyltransferase domain-containing protein [Deltaproteobacteria bacterium]
MNKMCAVRPADTARYLLRWYAVHGQDELPGAVELRARIAALVPVLAAELGAGRIFLFGSLAWGEVHEQSDVDLAVEGLPPGAEDVLAARLGDALQLTVEVVPLERAPASLQSRILADGVLLYRGEARES